MMSGGSVGHTYPPNPRRERPFTGAPTSEDLMKQPRRVGLAVKWLPVIIRLTALGYLLFFLPDLVLAATHRIHTLPSWLGRLFNWGERGDAIAVMFATVCTIWAVFLFRSARAPLTH